MRMSRQLIVITAAFTVVSVCAKDSAPFLLDTVTTSMSPLCELVQISWDASWVGGDINATVVIADNGTEVRHATGTGEFTYILSGPCRHDLTYTTYIDGVEQVETYSVSVFSKWKYVVESGNAVITETTQTIGTVVIPSEIDGHPVVGIAAKVFKGSSGLTNITIPDSVKKIGPSAFSDCTGLTNVTMPGRFEGNLDASVFNGCPDSLSINYVYTWFDVAFDANGGTVEESTRSVVEGSVLGTLPVPQREGYSFIGWYTSVIGGEQVTNMSKVWQAVTYYARWQAHQYTVTFDANGGSGGTSSTFDYGSVITMPTVMRMNCDFLGWFTAADSGTEVMPGTKASQDMVLYAHWEARPGVWLYDVLNGEVTITMCSSPLADIVIPSEIDGFPVTAIGEDTFRMSTNLVSVVIPDSVTRIGDYAFYGCGSLSRLKIGNGVTNIGESAFEDCYRLRNVTIPQYVCNDCMSNIFPAVYQVITNVVIQDVVTNIGNYAFNGCCGLKGVTIPDSVTQIGMAAFYNCGSLTGVAIPDSVVRIGESAFRYCGNLSSVHITDLAAWCRIGFVNRWSNPLYYAHDLYLNGALITELVIPDNVTSIKTCAFWSCTKLTSVKLPSRVTSIGRYAFYGCTGLMRMTIPNRVTSLGDSAFNACNRLSHVIFEGNAPSMGTNVFLGVASGCCAFVRQGTSGWGVSIPGTWNGIAIDYVHTYNVYLVANGGTCVTASLNVEDGSAVGTLPVPTREDAIFLGWFTRVEGGNRVDASAVVTGDVTFYAHWLFSVAPPVIVPTSGIEFRENSCEVTITCTTEGAAIYYSDDGSTPKMNARYLYIGPFTITETTTIRAIAVVETLQSTCTTMTITKVPLTLEEVLEVGEGVTVVTGEGVPWTSVILNEQDARSSSDVFAARSGAIGNKTNTWLSATVEGTGTMEFWCKTSCEHDEDGTYTWDRLMVYTNGVEIVSWRMDGESDWTKRTLSFVGGTNTVKWVYFKDKSDADGEDCAWVDGIVWTPGGGGTDVVIDMGGGKTVTVLGTWLADNTTRAATDAAANGRKVWECYVLGLDPEVATNDFKIVSFPMKADGTPDLEHIVFDPPQGRWNVPATYKVKGAATLEGPWEEVPAGGGALGESALPLRFFKVEVVLP